VVLPDSTIALDYMLDRVVWLVDGLSVDPERMLRNMEASHGLVFSGRALLAMVEAGASREAAYEITQRNALRAWDEETSFRRLLEADAEAMALLDASALDRVFDLDSFLRHVDVIFERALERGEVEHV
jgi:adenylosuccinate lyase